MKISSLLEVRDIPLDDREYKIISSNTGAKSGKIVQSDFFLDSYVAAVWIPTTDKDARKKLKALKVGEKFSYSNINTAYAAEVERVK